MWLRKWQWGQEAERTDSKEQRSVWAAAKQETGLPASNFYSVSEITSVFSWSSEHLGVSHRAPQPGLENSSTTHLCEALTPDLIRSFWIMWAKQHRKTFLALFPVLQSQLLTLRRYSHSRHHKLTTSDTNLWFCSHKHGPNFLQLLGFPLCFFLEAGVLLLNVQAFLLCAAFSTNIHTLI